MKKNNGLLKNFIRRFDFGIMGLQETNLNWNVLKPEMHWEERSFGW